MEIVTQTVMGRSGLLMPLEDKRLRRVVEREISKHALDISFLRVLCINEVIYIDGRVNALRGVMGRHVDAEQEMRKVVEATEMMPGVREVVTGYRVV